MKYGEFKILVAALGVASLTLQGCGKYEDGPAISLKTKNQRLTGEWKLVKLDGTELDSISISFEFEKDGDFTQKVSYVYSGGATTSYTYDGDWKWVDGKESLLIDVDDESTEYEILKLTSEEMVLKTQMDWIGINIEFEFEKQ